MFCCSKGSPQNESPPDYKVFNGFDLDECLVKERIQIRKEQNVFHDFLVSLGYTVHKQDVNYKDPSKGNPFSRLPEDGEKHILFDRFLDAYKCRDENILKDIESSYSDNFYDTLLPSLIGKEKFKEVQVVKTDWLVKLKKVELSDLRRSASCYAEWKHYHADMTKGWFKTRCVQLRPGARKLIEEIEKSTEVGLFFWTAAGKGQKKEVIDWLTGRDFPISRCFFSDDIHGGDGKKNFRSTSANKDRENPNKTIYDHIGAEPEGICFVDDKPENVEGILPDNLIGIDRFEGCMNDSLNRESDETVKTLNFIDTVKKLNKDNQRILGIDYDTIDIKEIFPDIDLRRGLTFVDCIASDKN